MGYPFRISVLWVTMLTLVIGLWGCSPAQVSEPPSSTPAPVEPDSETTSPSPTQPANVPTQEPVIIPTGPSEPLPTGLTPQDTPQSVPNDASAVPTEIVEPELDRFVRVLMTGQSDDIVGVYVENVLALRVVQQVEGNPAFVSSQPGVATEFLLAFRVAGNIGLLAHNYLAGALFFELQPGQVISIVYGDGTVEDFEVSRIERYQALDPYNPSSDFTHLENGSYLNATELFNTMYAGDYHLTMQTCIEKDGNAVWGRIFIISPPY
jgi:hypothetical protein